jgi:hypothetical protein
VKISFCTTCMNRLFHLKETYPNNLSSAESYADAEFVLLDYGGKDGLQTWVESELSAYLQSGRLKFIRAEGPRYWVAAHAKNIAHREATGEILCNLDADITIPPGFCEFVAESFSSRNIVMSFASEDAMGNNGCAGFVAARREHFYSVNGYDESINLGWGYDDLNYQFRVRMHNNLKLFTPPPIISCIPHANEVRTANCQLKDIHETMAVSRNICEDAALRKDYIANKGVDWGVANIVSNLSA